MNRGKEILVGVVIVAAVAVGVIGTLWLQEYSLARTERVLGARFLEVGQLMEGNDVKLRGVSIGRVSEIDVEPGGQGVLVTMRIRRDVTLPDDPVVILSPESMFGDWQAQITSRSQFPRFNYTEASEESVLPGYALPDISQLTASADEIAENFRTLTERVEVAFSEETARNVADAIENIEGVSQRLGQLVEQQAPNFEALVARLDTSATELGSAARSARSTFTRMDSLLGRSEVDSILVDSRATAENVRGLSEELTATTGQLNTTLARADSTFSRLNRIATRVDSGEGSLGRLLTDTTFIFRATETLAELQTLLQDFRENPSRYVRLSIF